MSTQNTWSTSARFLLVLGVGLLLVLAWIGGRVSAGDAGPMGMMGGGMHGQSMGSDQLMQGSGSMMGGVPVDSGDALTGEAGMQRCRAMMGTMAGMHRSMQSMMEQTDEGAEGASRARDGGGMMGGGKGGMQGDGDRRLRMRSMHDRMGAMMDDMGPERRRSLCRTIHEAMRAAMHGEAVASGRETDDTAFEETSLNDETKRWLRGARGFVGVEDRTGQDEAVIEVGAADGLQYGPAAVRVDPGTTVRWRWTGRGGLHNVAFANAEVRTSLKDEEGATFAYTFDAAGEYRYECTPHAGVGMRGVIIVAGDE